MTVKENLTRWAKYNHNIFIGKKSSSEEIKSFKKLSAELAAQSIGSIVISSIDKESYTLEYMEKQTKKSIKILISEIEAI